MHNAQPINQIHLRCLYIWEMNWHSMSSLWIGQKVFCSHWEITRIHKFTLEMSNLIWWISHHLSFSDWTQNAKSICVCVSQSLPRRSMRQKTEWNFSHLYLWLMRVCLLVYGVQDMLCQWVNGLYTMHTLVKLLYGPMYIVRVYHPKNPIQLHRVEWLGAQHNSYTNFFCWLDCDQKRWRKMSICQFTGRWICRK